VFELCFCTWINTGSSDCHKCNVLAAGCSFHSQNGYKHPHWLTPKGKGKVKVMSSLHMLWRQAGGMEVQPHLFVTSALYIGEWSDSLPGRFIPRKGVLNIHQTGQWVPAGIQWLNNYSLKMNLSSNLCIFTKYAITQSRWNVFAYHVRELPSQLHIKIYQTLQYIYMPCVRKFIRTEILFSFTWFTHSAKM